MKRFVMAIVFGFVLGSNCLAQTKSDLRSVIDYYDNLNARIEMEVSGDYLGKIRDCKLSHWICGDKIRSDKYHPDKNSPDLYRETTRHSSFDGQQFRVGFRYGNLQTPDAGELDGKIPNLKLFTLGTFAIENLFHDLEENRLAALMVWKQFEESVRSTETVRDVECTVQTLTLPDREVAVFFDSENRYRGARFRAMGIQDFIFIDEFLEEQPRFPRQVNYVNRSLTKEKVYVTETIVVSSFKECDADEDFVGFKALGVAAGAEVMVYDSEGNPAKKVWTGSKLRSEGALPIADIASGKGSYSIYILVLGFFVMTIGLVLKKFTQ